VRKKLAAQARRDEKESSEREGQFQADDEEAMLQGKAQRRIVEAVQHMDDDCFLLFQAQGDQHPGDYRRDGKGRDQRSSQRVTVRARHGPENLSFDALHGE
jgi:hypothetical protein